MIGLVIGACLFLVCGVIVGDLQLAWVLALSMLLVIIFAAMVGTGVPLLLHRAGADPAVATRPVHHHRQRHLRPGDLPGTRVAHAEPGCARIVSVLPRPMGSSRALVLRTWPSGETSVVASVLSSEHGLVRLIAKGARQERSRLRPLVQSGRLVDLEYSLDPARDLQYLRGGALILDPLVAGARLETTAYLQAALEIVDRCRPGDGQEVGLFALCHDFVQVLSCADAGCEARPVLSRSRWPCSTCRACGPLLDGLHPVRSQPG